jgi:hypothetical protein
MNETAVAPIVPEIVEDYPQLFLTALTEENIDRAEVPAILRGIRSFGFPFRYRATGSIDRRY